MQEQVNIKACSMIIKVIMIFTVPRDGLMEDWLWIMCADFRGRLEDVIEVEKSYFR